MVVDEVAAYYVAQGIGVLSSNIFKGSNAKLPELGKAGGAGPFILLTETPGSNPLFVHNYNTPHVQRPTMQVLTRGTNYLTVRQMAKAAYDVSFLWNVTLSGIRYIKLVARQEPSDMGHDDVGRVMISFNLEIEKAQS